MRAIFIRAPAILGVGPEVEVLARLEDGTVVAARQGKLLATAFHPEPTEDTRLHEYFVRLVGGWVRRRTADQLDGLCASDDRRRSTVGPLGRTVG